jgi:hypothetical protein
MAVGYLRRELTVSRGAVALRGEHSTTLGTMRVVNSLGETLTTYIEFTRRAGIRAETTDISPHLV